MFAICTDFGRYSALIGDIRIDFEAWASLLSLVYTNGTESEPLDVGCARIDEQHAIFLDLKSLIDWDGSVSI